eukprot:g553.t1
MSDQKGVEALDGPSNRFSGGARKRGAQKSKNSAKNVGSGSSTSGSSSSPMPGSNPPPSHQYYHSSMVPNENPNGSNGSSGSSVGSAIGSALGGALGGALGTALGGVGGAPPPLAMTFSDPQTIQKTLAEVESGLRSNLAERQLEATKKIRMLLSGERDVLIQDVLDRDVVPQLLSFLNKKGPNKKKRSKSSAGSTEKTPQHQQAVAGPVPPPELKDKHSSVTLAREKNDNDSTNSNEANLEFITPGAAAQQQNGSSALIDAARGDSKSGYDGNSSLEMTDDSEPEHSQLQIEALWALTNIAAGSTEHTHVLISNGAVPTLVSLLDSSNSEVLEQAAWVLGNVAGDGPAARDTVLKSGALKPLLNVIRQTSKLSLLRISTWALSNLCDGQPSQMFDVATVLPTLVKVLLRDDTEVLSHACWALSHLCDGPSPHVQAVVNVNVCKRLVNLLKHRSWRVVKPALRTIGNIVCAEDDLDYTQHIVEHGAVPCLRDLINHVNREIQKEACWTLSNIAAGTVEQIQFVLDSGSIPDLVQLAQDPETDPDVKIEACWVLLNATSCGSNPQIEYLVKHGCVSVLCALLSDASMIMMALEGLEKILQVGEFIAARSSKPIANPHAVLVDTAKETKWCSECKCSVCRNCDCSVYHLSYQESLWADIDASEAAEKGNTSNTGSSKSGNKKSKRAKKRAKEKLRRDKEREKKEKEEREKEEKRHLGQQKKAKQTSHQQTEKADSTKTDNKPTNNQTTSDSKIAKRTDNMNSNTKNDTDNANTSQKKTKRSGNTSANDTKEKSGDQKPELSTLLVMSAQNRSKETLEKKAEEGKKEWDAVEFLQSTGSILELAAMFDKMDDMASGKKERTGVVQ